MLADAKLPHKFWAEALSTAAYLRNRSPTKSVERMTPFEAWNGEKPKVDHLRTFGCASYAHVAKDERQKLDSKATKCILLGYGSETKGYRLYDWKRMKVFYSRDVIFCESECGFEKESSVQDPEERRYVEIEFPSDEEPVPVPISAEAQVEPTLRRSTRERRPPVYYRDLAALASSDSREPASVKEVLASPDKTQWLNAMEKEMDSLKANDVWDLVELPSDRTTVGSKWVFKLKTDADGKVERHKARLVAQGFSQKFGLDYDETFCPVVRFESFQALIALAAQNNLKLHQMDVITAFLNGELGEEIYMRQPDGIVVQGQEHLVCKLKKSIYGLKQSPRCWNSTLDRHLQKMGFVPTTSDPCIYTASEGEMFVIGVYVDDIVLAGRSDKRMTEVKRALAMQFEVKYMGELHYFLGVKVVQDHKKGHIWIGQPAYTESVLRKYGMGDTKPVNTPVEASSKLVKTTEECDRIDQGLYQSAVGSLLYLSVGTRPDVTFAVSNVAKYCAPPPPTSNIG